MVRIRDYGIEEIRIIYMDISYSFRISGKIVCLTVKHGKFVNLCCYESATIFELHNCFISVLVHDGLIILGLFLIFSSLVS